MRVILPLRQQKKQQQLAAGDAERAESEAGPGSGSGGEVVVEEFEPSDRSTTASEPNVQEVEVEALAESATSAVIAPSARWSVERKVDEETEGRSPAERSAVGPSAAARKRRVPSPVAAGGVKVPAPASASSVVAAPTAPSSTSSAAPSRSSSSRCRSPLEGRKPAASSSSLAVPFLASVEQQPPLAPQKPSGYVDRWASASTATAAAAFYPAVAAARSASGKDGKSRKRRHVGGNLTESRHSALEQGIAFSDSKPSSIPTGKATASGSASKKPRHHQPPAASAAATSRQSCSAAASLREEGAPDYLAAAPLRKVPASAVKPSAAPSRGEKKSAGKKMGRPPRNHSSASWGSADDDRAAASAENRENENDPPIELVRRRSNYNDGRDRRLDVHRNDENDPASPWMGVGGRYPSDPADGGAAAQQQNSSSCSSSSSSALRHRPPPLTASSSAPVPPSTSAFEAALKKRGLELSEQDGDGNCLFRAVSLQVYGDPNNHAEVRRRALDFMAKNEEHYSQFITDENFWDYIGRKRVEGVHGNNPEIQAISELYNRPVEVFVPENGAKPINIFHAEYKTSDAPIRLSYHDGNHYNAVIDPLCPTAGLGLGLPGLEPGLADKLQVERAKEESDRLQVQKIAAESHRAEVERVMKESKRSHDLMYKKKAFALSDLEATDFDLEQAVLESSLESYMNEQGRKQSHRDRRRQQGSSSPAGSSSRYSSSMASSSSMQQEEPITSAASMAVAAPASAAAAGTGAAAGFGADVGVPPHLLDGLQQDEYPPTVQELVMNGFELPKVIRAYELVGDDFDALLTFLMSNAS